MDTDKWIGIDLYEQVLTAYEGSSPVFTTLISSGLPQWPTNEGLHHVWLRHHNGSMSGAFQLPDFYSLQEVPWTQYFRRRHRAAWRLLARRLRLPAQPRLRQRFPHRCEVALRVVRRHVWDLEKGHGIAVYVYSTSDYESD